MSRHALAALSPGFREIINGISMIRKHIILSVFILMSISLFAQVSVNIKGGGQFFGNHHSEVGALKLDDKVNAGFSLGAELLWEGWPSIDIGIGSEFQLERELTDHSGEAFAFIPVYGVLRGKFTVGDITAYVFAKAGYNFILGNYGYLVSTDFSGGFYWSLGLGMILFDFIIVEPGFAVNYGSIGPIRVSYSHFDLGIGIRIKF
jgi:hypothetical protein